MIIENLIYKKMKVINNFNSFINEKYFKEYSKNSISKFDNINFLKESNNIENEIDKIVDTMLDFIDEDENISTHQVVWNMFPYQTRQAAEALAHIRSIAKKEVTLVGRETKHDDPC